MIWPWSKKLRQTERQLSETQTRLKEAARRLVELEDLCERQQQELIALHARIALHRRIGEGAE